MFTISDNISNENITIDSNSDENTTIDSSSDENATIDGNSDEDKKESKKEKVKKFFIEKISFIEMQIKISKELAKSRLNTLGPREDINYEEYDEILDDLLADNHKQYKNIAITGAYGVGKSSVINSYLEKNKYKKNKVVRIGFNDFKESQDRERSKQNIEKHLIEQLVNQLNPKIVNKSIFAPKYRANKFEVTKTALSILVIIITTLLLISHTPKQIYCNYLEMYENARQFLILNESNISNYIFIIVLCVIALSGFYLIAQSVTYFKTKGFIKKIKIGTNEIELFDPKIDSYIDKYTIELVYLISESNVKIFVFEDIDRYQCANEIFEELRNLNTNLNSKYNNKKVYKFLYVVKDNIFKVVDRVKFFDYIMPIKPVLNNVSALTQFKKLIKNDYKFDEQFIATSLIYISDMRTVVNIANEFLLYRDSCENIAKHYNDEVFNTKLFALIVYKNILPLDFVELQRNKGILYGILNKDESEIIKNEIGRIDRDIQKINQEYQALLDINKNTVYYNISSNINLINNTYKSINERIQKEPFKNLYSEFEAYINIINANKAIGRGKVDGEKYDIFERTLLIKYNLRYLKKILRIQKCQLEQILKYNVEVLNNKYLESYFEDVKGTFIDNDLLNKIDSSYKDLIKLMIGSGYLGRDYYIYISNSNYDDLSQQDLIFIKKVINGEKIAYDFKIDSTNAVCKKLNQMCNTSSTALCNFYMLEQHARDGALCQIENYFSHLQENSLYFEFIAEYINYKIIHSPNNTYDFEKTLEKLIEEDSGFIENLVKGFSKNGTTLVCQGNVVYVLNLIAKMLYLFSELNNELVDKKIIEAIITTPEAFYLLEDNIIESERLSNKIKNEKLKMEIPMDIINQSFNDITGKEFKINIDNIIPFIKTDYSEKNNNDNFVSLANAKEIVNIILNSNDVTEENKLRIMLATIIDLDLSEDNLDFIDNSLEIVYEISAIDYDVYYKCICSNSELEYGYSWLYSVLKVELNEVLVSMDKLEPENSPSMEHEITKKEKKYGIITDLNDISLNQDVYIIFENEIIQKFRTHENITGRIDDLEELYLKYNINQGDILSISYDWKTLIIKKVK